MTYNIPRSGEVFYLPILSLLLYLIKGKTEMQTQNFLQIIFPSFNNDLLLLEKSLKWGTRLYAVYSLILFELIRFLLRGSLSLDSYTLLWLFMIQAALLLYVFQSYRRFFALANAHKRTYIFISLVFSWLIIYFLFNIFQIIFMPFFAAGETLGFSWMLHIFSISLAFLGEYLYRKAVKVKN